jgi:hypothetical protein
VRDTFWKPTKTPGDPRWLVERNKDGEALVALTAAGARRSFKFYEGASAVARKLNDELPSAEYKALWAAGERF